MSNYEKINFRISGTELNVESGFDLHYLSQSMELFHQLIEKTYLTLKDEKNMSKAKREDLKIKVFNIRPGSFEADFIITIKDLLPSLLPMVTTLDAKNVWELAKNSFKYLKTILEANNKGETLKMEVNNSENVQIVNGTGHVLINIHPDVITAAKETYPVYKKLANLIDDEKKTFEKAIFSDFKNENENIEIGVVEKILLQNQNIIDEEPIEFKGKIFNADANKYSGKLEVIESPDIPSGEYSFEFIEKKNRKVKEYFDEEFKFSALKLTSFNPNTLERSIKKLKIVNVYPIASI